MVRIAGQVPGRGAAGITPVVIMYERPSRISRAVVFLFALVVLVLGGWVLTPIVLAKYPTAIAAIPLLRDVADSRGSDSRPAIASTTERETREARDLASRDLVIEPPVEKSDSVAEKSDPVVQTSEPAPVVETVETVPPPVDAPEDRPTLAAASAVAAPSQASETVAAITAGSRTPWPIAESAGPPAEVAVAEDLSALPVDTGPVPLPRRRPDMAALARLAIPLPRPRPFEVPASAAAETLPPSEQLLFDRLSAPN